MPENKPGCVDRDKNTNAQQNIFLLASFPAKAWKYGGAFNKCICAFWQYVTRSSNKFDIDPDTLPGNLEELIFWLRIS